MAALDPLSNRLAGVTAALCGVVAVIHLQDQDWLSFHKTPAYVQVGYLLLEVACLAVAAALLLRPVWSLWLLALGCGVAPLLGYVLSRGPGLPMYANDRGNWWEPLGVVSLVVEATLLVVALAALVRCQLVTAPERGAQRAAASGGAASRPCS